MPSVTARIPDPLRLNGYIGEPLNQSAKSRISSVIARGIKECPALPLPMISAHANFWISKPEFDWLTKLGATKGLSAGEAITALLWADSEDQSRKASPTVQTGESVHPDLLRVLKAMGRNDRIEQSRFYKAIDKITQIEDSSKLPKVLFAEAGTGVGKTIAYLSAAHAFIVKNPEAQIGIAVPTHSLMNQVMKEFNEITSSLREQVSTATLLGQSEFVSQEALIELLSEIDEETRECIEEWIHKGARPEPDSVIRHHWSMSGLMHAAPAFDRRDDVVLDARETDQDLGYISYKAQWINLPGSSLIIMSHAMLASLVRRRISSQAPDLKGSDEVKDAIDAWKKIPKDERDWKDIPLAERKKRLYEVLNDIYATADTDAGFDALPNLDLLIIDEAHTLEDAFSMILSQNISLWKLTHDIAALSESHPKAVPRAVFGEMEAILKRFQNSPSASLDKVVSLQTEDFQTLSHLNDILKRVTGISAAVRKKLGDRAGFRRLMQVARTINLAVATADGLNSAIGATIDWSPHKKWPRLQIGRTSVAREMNYLWKAVAKRTILVSGTLYTEIPQISCETARRSLAVSPELVMTMEPVHAAWSYVPVTACIISPTSMPDGRSRFMRPKANNDGREGSAFQAAHNAWIGDITGYITQSHSVAVGGTLVLGTAFSDIAAIEASLQKSLPYAVILTQKSGVRLSALKEQYLLAVRSGVRPILLAVGGAWTGFDLHDPEHPNALTDLVILNAPFGAISRSLVRHARAQENGGIFEIIGLMVVLVRQGVGRLVRSPETPPNRRIHWLDARIHEASQQGLFMPVKRLLSKYKMLAV